MADPTPLRLLFVDDEAASESNRLFGRDCTKGFTDVWNGVSPGVQLHAMDDPDDLIERLSKNDFADLAADQNGDFSPDAILLDINFAQSAKNRLSLADPPPTSLSSSEKSNWGHVLLKTVKRIDPDMPVIMLTALTEADVGYRAGSLGAEAYWTKDLVDLANTDEQYRTAFLTSILRAIDFCRLRPYYDREHCRLVDSFAKTYDDAERRCSATMVYYRFENELILKLVSELTAARGNARIRILDLGCGTGRIEETIGKSLRPQELARLHIVAVDFSGKMLAVADQKLRKMDQCQIGFGQDPDTKPNKLSVSLYRAPAENLDFLADRYPERFDFVIMGFGLLSYVRHKQVLPSVIGRTPTEGVVPLVKPGGKLLFSVYNERSIIYERVRLLKDSQAERDLPIAALMNLATGRLQVCEALDIACEAFHVDGVLRLIRQGGLTVNPDDVMTFPTLHLMLQNSQVMGGDLASQHLGFADDPILPPGKFSESLLQVDVEMSRALRDRGHYVVGLATRETEA